MQRISDWARRVRLREWWFCILWLVGLASGVRHTLAGASSPVVRLAVLCGVAAYCVAFVTCFALAEADHRTAVRYTAAGTMCTITLLFTGLLGRQWLPLFIYVALSLAITLPLRRALVAVGVLVCLGFAVSAVRGYPLGEYGWVLLSAAFGGGFASIGAERRRVRDRLRQGERAMAQLAVNEERLRFARDLHDLLGHSLSLLALKSQLAGRLVTTDPEACARQLAEMEEISRRALAEVRDSVTGYRRPTLAVELARARTSLATAGIALEVAAAAEARARELAPAREAALAWALRESVTNVLRHATGATSCRVRLERDGAEFVLEVQDDGRGAEAAPGNGLTGLGERLALEGGRLDAARNGTGFRVRAYVPAESAALTHQS